MKHGKVSYGILFGIWKSVGIFSTADIPQNTVDKSCNMTPTLVPGLPDSLIHSGGFRDPVHEKYLKKCNTQDVQDGRFDLLERKVNGLFDNPVQSKPPPENSLNQVNRKGPVAFIQIGIIPECSSQVGFGEDLTEIQAVQGL
jgi:hypothetical protein